MRAVGWLRAVLRQMGDSWITVESVLDTMKERNDEQ